MNFLINKILHFSLYKLFIKYKIITINEEIIKSKANINLTIGYSEKYNLILIHNPKVAGNSLIDVLEIPMFFNHQYPLRRFTIEEWERNRFLLVVRHSIDRLVSAYYYHTGDMYNGGYMKLFPNLKNIGSLYDYFKSFAAIENTITPQYNYTYRPGSDKKVDFILKFENLEMELKNNFNIESELPKKNQTYRLKKPRLSSKELNIILNYYNIDFEMFGYYIKDSCNFVEIVD